MEPVETLRPRDEVVVAWEGSYLAELPTRLSAALLEGTFVEEIEAGELMIEGHSLGPAADVFLIVDGLVRIYLAGPDGRQATVRYASECAVIGLPPLLVAGMDMGAEAVTAVRALRFPSRRFIALAERDVGLAWPTACYIAQQLGAGNDVLAADIFLPVRARLARHLLDLARRGPHGMTVFARHQHLADAIGSVREVVSREMTRLSEKGLVRRIDEGTLLTDPAALHRLSSGVSDQ
jgi:CRP-like cAMP-binding protein